MKKNFLLFLTLLILSGCSFLTKRSGDLQAKYKITEPQFRDWEPTFSNVITEESLIVDWYSDMEPLTYLMRSQKLTQQDVDFLNSLKSKDFITPEDQDEYMSLLSKVANGLPKTYKLKNENFKNPIGLAKYMVAQSKQKLQNPSNHIAYSVATEEEWQSIIAMSEKNDLDKKDIINLRKLLNKFIKNDNLFTEQDWYATGVSSELLEIVELNKKTNKTKLEKNNINSKAMYIAYQEYLSKLDKWDN